MKNKTIGKSTVDKAAPQQWTRKYFKRNKVWMASDESGEPLIQKNRVLIKYQLDQPHEYWVLKKHIRDIPDRPEASPAEEPPGSDSEDPSPVGDARPEKEESVQDNDAIVVYTDGASSGNPGPSGVGIVLRYRGRKREISKYIGIATNNIAELEAVRTALTALKRKDLPVRVHTDSEYVYGILVSGWRVRKNQQLVTAIREMVAKYPDIQFIKVRGHQGVSDNERADRLATSAIRQPDTEK